MAGDIKLLVKVGAEIPVPKKDGLTPLDVAILESQIRNLDAFKCIVDVGNV